MKLKVFGREPVTIIAAIQAILALLASIGALNFIGANSQAAVTAVVGVLVTIEALYVAYVTNETLLAPVVATFKAVLALGAIYGLDVTDEQTGLTIAAIASVLALWQRTQVSPLQKPTFAREG